MVLGLPGVGPRLLGTAALRSLGRLSPAALAERTQIALFDATRLAAAFELARGSNDALYVGRSTVLRTALDMAAHSFVLAHDHPSGDPTPTREDEAMTLELRPLSAELEVPLKAHVIVTPSGRYAAVDE
ncbi:JAB domain-containing protein [Sorangium sp. So ce590]|uniref:JAB domain-containing protein n=1 Tax=Sorangium sp. So ce590 TaxID=3133317 RepID=UPI003F5F9464